MRWTLLAAVQVIGVIKMKAVVNTSMHVHTALVRCTLCIYNPLTQHPHTDTVSAAKEMILNMQEGYQIAPRNQKKMSGEDEN